MVNGMGGDEDRRQTCIEMVNLAERRKAVLWGELEDHHIHVVVPDYASNVTNVLAGESLPACGTDHRRIGQLAPRSW